MPGKVHCYALVRDFFRDNFDIELPDYAIPHDWDADKLDLIGAVYERTPFEKVEDWNIRKLRPGDILCTAYGSSNPNHLVVVLPGNQVLHHPLAQLSRIDPMRDFFRMTTCYVVRHPDVPDLTPELAPTTIQDLIDARYRPQAEA